MESQASLSSTVRRAIAIAEQLKEENARLYAEVGSLLMQVTLLHEELERVQAALARAEEEAAARDAALAGSAQG